LTPVLTSGYIKNMEFHERALRENGDHGVLAAHASAIAGIQRGLQGMYQGRGEDAEDAFASLEREMGTSEYQPGSS
jgi:hypothetical protein